VTTVFGKVDGYAVKRRVLQKVTVPSFALRS